MVVQVYKNNLGLNQFSAVHARVAFLQALSFLHVPSDHFLCKLSGEHTCVNSLRLNSAANSMYSELNRPTSKARIEAAVKLLDVARKRGEKKAGAVVTSLGGDGEDGLGCL